MVGASAEQSRRKANMVAQGDGKFGPEADPRITQNKKHKSVSAGESKIEYEIIQPCKHLFSFLCPVVLFGLSNI